MTQTAAKALTNAGWVAPDGLLAVEMRRGAPLLGADTEDVLTEFGLSAPEVTALREAGVVGG